MTTRITMLVAAAMLVGLSFWGPFDRHGEAVANELLVKGTVVYAVTRGATGVLTLLEEIEVDAAVVSGKPFRILNPLIDLLDRFSSVLFFSISSLALLKLLTWLFGSTAFAWLYAAVAAACVAAAFATRAGWPLRALLVASVVRFAFVLVVGLNHLAYEVFLEERQVQASAQLEARASVVEAVSDEIWNQGLNPVRLVDDVKARANAVVDTVIDITVLFLLQAVVIPLAFFWCVLALLRRLAAPAT